MLIAVELVVAAVPSGAVKFLGVRRCGLSWLLAVCAMVGCSEPREVLRVDELCPSNMEEPVALLETNLTCVLDAMVARGRVAYVTNSVGRSVVVRKVTTVDFFLNDVTLDGAHGAFCKVNEAFERGFTHQMRQRYPSAYAAAIRSDGNPHNPALAASWRHMEECVRATSTWQMIFVHLKKRGVDKITFRPPEKFYLDGREVRDRCFHLSGWAFQFAEDSCGGGR